MIDNRKWGVWLARGTILAFTLLFLFIVNIFAVFGAEETGNVLPRDKKARTLEEYYENHSKALSQMDITEEKYFDETIEVWTAPRFI